VIGEWLLRLSGDQEIRVQDIRSSGYQEFWVSGVLGIRSSGYQEFWVSGVLGIRII